MSLALDLERFLAEDVPPPTADDAAALRALLDAAASMPPKATASRLERALAGIFPGDKNDRRSIIETLAICGVLRPKDVPDFFSAWVPFEQRRVRGWSEWEYPSGWWRAESGVCVKAVRHWFPSVEWEPPRS